MSHFSTVRVSFRDIDVLEQVLLAKNYRVERNSNVRGWERKTQKADLVVKRSDYDIGFVRNDDNEFDMVADWWAVKMTPHDFLNQIQQEYAKEVILKNAQKMGMNIQSQSITEDGSIKIVLGAWA